MKNFLMVAFFLVFFGEKGLSQKSPARVEGLGQAQTFRLYLPLVMKKYPDPANILLSCQRPYADSSIWNTPIHWSTAHIHANSAQMMAAFFKTHTSIGANTLQYAPNIYFATNQTPLMPVKLRWYISFQDAIDDLVLRYGEKGATVWVPIPANALPSPGTDGELVIINIDSGEEWGISKGKIDSPGHWLAGGLYRYHVWNSGLPPKGFSQRGAGVGALAGIVRPCEVARGEIGHALTLGYNYPCASASCLAHGYPASAPPFTKTDGSGTAPYDLPEGARLAIRPEITAAQIQQACAGVTGCVAWVKAMQSYGAYIVDRSGHPKTYGEGNITAQWDPAIWTDKMLQNVPQSWYIVLDWNFPQ